MAEGEWGMDEWREYAREKAEALLVLREENTKLLNANAELLHQQMGLIKAIAVLGSLK